MKASTIIRGVTLATITKGLDHGFATEHGKTPRRGCRHPRRQPHRPPFFADALE